MISSWHFPMFYSWPPSVRTAPIASSSWRRCPKELTPISLRSSAVKLGKSADVILAECRLATFEAKASQPVCDIHRRFLRLGDARGEVSPCWSGRVQKQKMVCPTTVWPPTPGSIPADPGRLSRLMGGFNLVVRRRRSEDRCRVPVGHGRTFSDRRGGGPSSSPGAPSAPPR